MGFSKQEYWSALPFPSPGDLPDPRIKPGSPALVGRFLNSDPLGNPLKGCEVKWSEVKSLSLVWLFTTSWTVAYQAPLSMGFARQEYWSALPFPSPGDLPDPGIEIRVPCLAGKFFTTEPLGNQILIISTSKVLLWGLKGFIYILVAQKVKRLPTMQETQVQSLGWEDLLEKEMAMHSSILAWQTP